MHSAACRGRYITVSQVGTYVSRTLGQVYQRIVGSGYPELLQVRVLFSRRTAALGDPERFHLNFIILYICSNQKTK